MTKSILLHELKSFCDNAVKKFKLPTVVQKGNAKQEFRPPYVYQMRLPHGNSTNKVVPYIILQLITGKDWQPEGQQSDSITNIRMIFCVYHEDCQEGALQLLDLMETIRIELLKQSIVGEKYLLDRKEGIEMLIYPDDTAPYYMGEMMTTWHLPPVEREVCPWEDMKGGFYDEKEINRQ